MKAKVLMLTLLGTFAISSVALAQTEVKTTQNLSGHKTVFAKDAGHWFIDIEGGAVMLPFGQVNNKAKFMDRVSLGMPMLGIGKWHTPWFGSRVQMYGWRAYSFTYNQTTDNQLQRWSNFFAGANYQFLFDMVNYFGHYSPTTVFHVIPYVGLGGMYYIQTTKDDQFTPAQDKAIGLTTDFMDRAGVTANAGILFKFRLGKHVDLNIDAQMIAGKVNFYGGNHAYNQGADIMALLTAGLGFNLGNSEFTEVVPMDWALVNDLNAQINALRAENAELSKRPEFCPECPQPTEAQPEQVTNVYYSNVFFRLNKDVIDPDQKINVEATAAYAKENGSKVYLCGYADAQTGTAEYNMNLSERRVRNVEAMLIELGVPADQIVIDFKGSSEQPYEVNNMNRVVIATGQPAK